jgi:hypothetical protein
MARADQDRQNLERWLKDAEPRDDGSLLVVLQVARQALASGNANRIYDALITCLAADRHAVELAVQNVQARRRRAGGRQRGVEQVECANKKWAPHRARYRELVDAGKSPATALAVVRDQMGASAPSDKTLRKQLRKKSVLS